MITGKFNLFILINMIFLFLNFINRNIMHNVIDYNMLFYKKSVRCKTKAAVRIENIIRI